jgi:hypothetical protein
MKSKHRHAVAFSSQYILFDSARSTAKQHPTPEVFYGPQRFLLVSTTAKPIAPMASRPPPHRGADGGFWLESEAARI